MVQIRYDDKKEQNDKFLHNNLQNTAGQSKFVKLENFSVHVMIISTGKTRRISNEQKQKNVKKSYDGNSDSKYGPYRWRNYYLCSTGYNE